MSPGKEVQSADAAEPPPPPPPPRNLSHNVRALLRVFRNWPLLLQQNRKWIVRNVHGDIQNEQGHEFINTLGSMRGRGRTKLMKRAS